MMNFSKPHYITLIANNRVKKGAIGTFVSKVGETIELRFTFKPQRFRFRKYHKSQLEKV